MLIKSLDLTLIRKSFVYKDGWLYWSNAVRPTLAGRRAGTSLPRLAGRVCVKLGHERYYAHRIIWSLHNGEIPEGMFIDHINNDPSDNRIENLRLATRGQNTANSRTQTRSSTKFKGVTFHKRVGKFMAQIKNNSSGYKYLGYFETPEAAHEAYKAAALELHGEFARCE